MIFSQRTKRYGKAFINFFYKKDPKNLPYEQYIAWKNGLTNYKKHLLILSMGSITQHIKDALIKEICHLYTFNIPEEKLLRLLCIKKDIHLLPELIEYLCIRYQDAHNIEPWHITSAVPITAEEQKKITEALSIKRKKQIIATYTEKPTIFAGYIMRNTQYYWDCSLHAFLKKITRFVHK